MKSEVDLTMSVCPSVCLSVCLSVCPPVDMGFPKTPDMMGARLLYICVTYSPEFVGIEIQQNWSRNG